jgi:hypothetical protein
MTPAKKPQDRKPKAAKTKDAADTNETEINISIGEFIQSLNMEELDTAETLSGMSLDEFEQEGRSKGLFIAAVAWVAKRRSDNKFTWLDARQLDLKGVKEVLAEAYNLPKAKSTALQVTGEE